MNMNNVNPYYYTGYNQYLSRNVHYMIVPIWHPYIQQSIDGDVIAFTWRKLIISDSHSVLWKYMKDAELIFADSKLPSYVCDEFLRCRNDDYVLVNLGHSNPEVMVERFFMGALEYLRSKRKDDE